MQKLHLKIQIANGALLISVYALIAFLSPSVFLIEPLVRNALWIHLFYMFLVTFVLNAITIVVFFYLFRDFFDWVESLNSSDCTPKDSQLKRIRWLHMSPSFLSFLLIAQAIIVQLFTCIPALRFKLMSATTQWTWVLFMMVWVISSSVPLSLILRAFISPTFARIPWKYTQNIIEDHKRNSRTNQAFSSQFLTLRIGQVHTKVICALLIPMVLLFVCEITLMQQYFSISKQLFVLMALAFILIVALSWTSASQVSKALEAATSQLNTLGTQTELHDSMFIKNVNSLQELATWSPRVEQIGHRFQEFSLRQEQVIEAHERTQKTRDLFFTSMSHDLRSPLNGILGFASLLQRLPLSAAQRESLSIIERRGRVLLELIENILDASKMEAGRLELARDWVAPTDLLRAILQRGHELAEEKTRDTHHQASPIILVGELQPNMSPIYVDSPKLLQALINVIAGMIKCMEQGFLRVRIAYATPIAGRPRIKFEIEDHERTLTQGNFLAFSDAFNQSVYSRRYGGLGLGLSMARALFELHGGAVEVESTQEQGSIFRMWVPLITPEEEPQSRLTTYPPQALS